MKFPQDYNASDARDILRYAKWLQGKTFMDVLKTDQLLNRDTLEVSGCFEDSSVVLEESTIGYGNAQRKGGLGNLIEEHFFHYKANSNQEPDFPMAKLELKVTPYEKRNRRNRGKNTDEVYYVAGERLVLTMIDFNQRPIQLNLLESHLWHKCSQILLIYYLRDRSIGNNLLYPISYVDIFTPNAADLIIIRQDYQKIMDKIAKGQAHEISESDTMYLGACTKGSTAAKSIVIQKENGIPAQKRAFCFKISYMTTVLNEYFIKAQKDCESVVTDTKLLEKLGFEGYIQSKINQYIGKSDRELCSILNIEYTGNKAQWINIAFAMLGIKSNKAIEFQKANIVVKATRIDENGNIRENTSFPPFKFKDLVQEQWVESYDTDNELSSHCHADISYKPSSLQLYFTTTKFLFVVFKKINGEYYLKGCQLWNMPYKDLNYTVRQGWEKIRDTISSGVKFDLKPVKSGKRIGKFNIENNLPKKSDNPIIHIRPHAQKAYYKFGDYEEGNPKDGNELPDGRWMTTQCFWLNNTYVKSILREELT